MWSPAFTQARIATTLAASPVGSVTARWPPSISTISSSKAMRSGMLSMP
jgi:hypothetical protein